MAREPIIIGTWLEPEGGRFVNLAHVEEIIFKPGDMKFVEDVDAATVRVIFHGHRSIWFRGKAAWHMWEKMQGINK